MKNIIIIMFLLLIANIFYGQCTSEAHSNNINDAWLSCEKSDNPNPAREESHWILYDLGYIYSIGTTKFWNYNVAGETEKGMKNITIDYSLNGTTWTEAATFELSEALGNNNYEGVSGPDLNKLNARYILISATDTWGNGDCAGLSEVRFDVDGTVTQFGVFKQNESVNLFPNPANDQLSIDIDFPVKEIIVVNASGHEIMRANKAAAIDISFLSDGLYFLKIINDKNEMMMERFVKQQF